MKLTTLALTVLSVVGRVASESVNVDGDDVPFYLKTSESNPDSIIAVVYYGEMGDESKEIEVPCTMKGAASDKYVGPESMTCQCEVIRRGCGWGSSSSHTKTIDNSKCQLQVPFIFEHDVNGTITSVTFIKDSTNSTTGEDILIVPFYPKKDRDGNIVAVEVSANETAQQSSSTTEAAISLLLWFLIIVGGIILLVSLVRIVQNLIRRTTTKPTHTSTPAGNHQMNVKNLADLETAPQRSSNQSDDDTVSNDSDN